MTYVEEMYNDFAMRVQENKGLASSIEELNVMIDALTTERDAKILKLQDKKDRGLIKKEDQRYSIFRLMNDIRLGKIIPVVAENGTIANVTFS